MKKVLMTLAGIVVFTTHAQTTPQKATPVQKEHKATTTSPPSTTKSESVELKKATPGENKTIHTESISAEQKQEIKSSGKSVIIENIEEDKLETPEGTVSKEVEVSNNVNTYSFNHSVSMDEEKSKRWANRMIQENKTIEEITIDSTSCQVKLVSGLSNDKIEKSISYCVSKFGYATFKIK